jgi:chromate transporter
VNALVTAWTETEVVWIFLLSGVIALVILAPPRPQGFGATLSVAPIMEVFLPGISAGASSPTLFKIFIFFAEAGAVVFGSGLAIVPFLHGSVVEKFAWLNERQFLDAVAVAMITPGPVVITVGFIGYIVAGPAGAALAALGVFLPCYLFVIIPAPYYRKFAGNRSIKAFVDGVTAAATGAIAGAAFVLGRRAIVDVPTILIFLVTLILLTKVSRIPEPAVILASGIVGLAVRGVAGT